MLVVGIIIAIFSFMTMLCSFATYSVLMNLLAQTKNQNELFKKLLRK